MTQPDLSMYAAMIPGSGMGVPLGAALVFALFTAIAEEIVFRGVIWQALVDTGFTVGWVWAVQGLTFEVLHLGGVPPAPSLAAPPPAARAAAPAPMRTIYSSALKSLDLVVLQR